ncbi:MAG: alpha/beta fold hydrolase [Alphaproteobacteria bacterium]|nr:alpha/beta fold hydrolase [Alphaproteobacteria bacterium]
MLALLLLACADDIEVPVDSGASLPELDVAWQPCSLYEGEDDGLAECATVLAPLDWTDPDSPLDFELRVKRLPAPGAPDLSLWLLDGGPGGAGTYDFPPRMQALQERLPDAEILTLDHRGTGHSERLGCSAEDGRSEGGAGITDAELPACVQELSEAWGERLEAVTTTQSAFDLAGLIAASREADTPVFVWGGSYGTYWAQRYLRVAPDQADGVVLEGIFPADGTLIYAEEYTNRAAQETFSRCAEDEVCRSYLGEDPWARLGEVLARMESEGHCGRQGLTADLMSTIFAYLSYSRAGHAIMPAATWRLDRCSLDDSAALVNLYTTLFGSGGAFDLGAYSMLLQHHVATSEMWTHPDFEGVDMQAYYDALYDEALVVKGYGYSRLEAFELWPRYSDPEHDDQWPETDTPLLMLNGELDPVTPHALAQAVAAHLDGPNQTYVSFPASAHGVSFDSPVAEGEPCGLQLMLAFLEDPEAPVDTSCVDETLPLPVDPPASYARYFFGTADAWE